MRYTKPSAHSIIAFAMLAGIGAALLVAYARPRGGVKDPERAMPSQGVEDPRQAPAVAVRSSVRDASDRRPEPPSASQPSGRTIRGRVVDQNGVGVADAAIYAIDEHSTISARCRSDLSGGFGIPDPPTGQLLLVASALEHASTYRYIDILGSEITDVPEVELVLEEECFIAGIVRSRSGAPASAGTTIMATEILDSGFGPADLSLIAEGASVHKSATSDEQGRFRIGGLRRTGRYKLTAGGCGQIEDPEFEDNYALHICAQASGVELRVTAVYVVDLEVVGEGGRPLEADSDLFAYPMITLRSPNECELFPLDAYAAWLIPYLRTSARRSNIVGRQIHAFTTRDDSKVMAGSATFFVSAPGYEPKEVSVPITRLGASEPARHSVQLSRVARAFGNANIRISASGLTGLESLRSNRNLLTPFATLEFRSEDREKGQDLARAVWSPQEFPLRVSGVPTGEYLVRLRLPLMPYAKCEAKLLVVESSTTDVLLPFPDWSIIQVRPLVDSGARSEFHSGPLRFEVIGPKPLTSGASVSFRGPPYEIIGLAPGNYEISGQVPGTTWRSDASVVSLDANRIHCMDLRLESKGK